MVALLLVVFACTFALAAVPPAEPAPGPTPATTPPSAPVVVVELFTSEGCSSCPPADDLLAELAKQQAEGKRDEGGREKGDRKDGKSEVPDAGTRIIFLTFHVDYWDRLGWPDRFASAQATERQRVYGAALKERKADSGGVYTPQMVVNGSAGFVGSDAKRARAEIAAAAKGVMPVGVTLDVEAPPERGPFTLTVTLKDAPKGCVVLGALVEDGLSTEVKRGENAGRKLAHDRVVRVFKVQKPDAKGVASIALDVPKDASLARSRVVAVVQEAPGGKVIGAAERVMAMTAK